MGLEMRRQDMEEMYQLLSLYERIYGTTEAKKLSEELEERYCAVWGEDIRKQRNPRNAGRKSRYTETEKEQIRVLRGEGFTVRKIAEKTGISVGYVQGVLREPT